MWRIIKVIGRGLRSVRPRQCCPQDCTDDVNNRELGKPKYLVYCTVRDYSSTHDHCLSTGNRKNGPLFPINVGAPVPKKELVFHENFCGCKRVIAAGCHSSSKEEQPTSGNSDNNYFYSKPPPWLWQCLLHKCPQKRLTDEKSEKGHEESEDWRKKCRREHFLFTHSVLQGLGWGSAVAFTWSLYRDLEDLRKYPNRWKNQKQGEHAYWLGKNETFADKGIQKNNVYFENYECNNEESFTDHFKRCSKTWAAGPLYVHSVQSQCHNCEEQCHKNLDENAQNYPLMHLWDIGLYTDTFKRVVNYESWVKRKNPDTSVRIYALDIEKAEDEVVADSNAELSLHIRTSKREIGEAENDTVESRSAELLSYKSENENVNEHTSKDGTLCLDDGACSRIYGSDSGCVSGSIRTCIQPEAPAPPDNGEDHMPTQEEGKQITSAGHNSSKYKLHKEESAAPSVATKSEVLIEDCSESGDEDGSTKTRNQTLDQGINKFSDSLLELLTTGTEDLRSLEAKFHGVLESEVGVSLVETDPGRAVSWFRAGALLGDPAATFNLALCYYTGQGVGQDLAMARELYEAASLAGHGWGSYNLAVMLSRGEGGPADREQAHSLLSLAAKRGVQQAQRALPLFDYNRQTQRQTSAEMKYTQSEPALGVSPSVSWLSSYSTSDLSTIDESDTCSVNDLSRQVSRVQESKPQFFL